MGVEQRQHPRYETDLAVEIRGDAGARGGNMRNLSATGAAIEFAPDLGYKPLALDIGAAVEMHADQASPLKGRVVRSYEGGIAMTFEDRADDMVENLARIARETGGRRD
jgi:hypothetical protein